ncbi:fluoride efflux transporter CrcB [Ectobacillus antri]|jgi:CrcB protein|uniref:Fluoride-specific ion channel FluC n=1 Tax=Ectobacillus antri TaxID=2486280 RepID=A0ABT6H2K2_9BACI|nr:fluoride efflux transporter CrcB [Ectobacillus antri]MDG4655671.1 fluoride efflux transporter CrcB [Ectobacillus antri]MDG5753429.1 fluoride efflux transporter CrcB [Ectobacillus antri]
MNILLVALGGSLGAVLRFMISNVILARSRSHFPYGTLIVNFLGSFLLGILLSYGVQEKERLLLAVGFMGAFTTFSTFQVECVRLYREKQYRVVSWYILSSYILGIGATYFGFYVAH